MPSRDWRIRIEDILDAVGAVQEYVTGMGFDEFTRDRRTIDAVLRRFTVIGEAAAHVPAEVCSRYPEVPWGEMRAMRNFVVHEYFGVSEKILWDTIQVELPEVVSLLRKVLEGTDERP